MVLPKHGSYCIIQRKPKSMLKQKENFKALKVLMRIKKEIFMKMN